MQRSEKSMLTMVFDTLREYIGEYANVSSWVSLLFSFSLEPKCLTGLFQKQLQGHVLPLLKKVLSWKRYFLLIITSLCFLNCHFLKRRDFHLQKTSLHSVELENGNLPLLPPQPSPTTSPQPPAHTPAHQWTRQCRFLYFYKTAAYFPPLPLPQRILLFYIGRTRRVLDVLYWVYLSVLELWCSGKDVISGQW